MLSFNWPPPPPLSFSVIDAGLSSTMEYVPFRPLEQGTFPIIVALDATLTLPALWASSGIWPFSELPRWISPALPPVDGLWSAPLLFYLLFGGIVYAWSAQESDRMMPREINSYLMKARWHYLAAACMLEAGLQVS